MRLITGSRSPKNQKGLAMVFTIFLAVGLQTLIVGSMMNMMRHDREVQRISHQNQAQWIADAVTERALKLLADHIKVTDQLPTPTVMNSFFGSSPVANGRSFTWFLIQDWYNTYFRSRYPMASRIAVSNVYFRTISAGGSRGTYAIEVTVQNYESKAKAISSQQVSVTTGRLFDYAVFYDEDLEIAGGPSMTLQGPLFSNKNVYLMNNNGSTLRLLRSKDFLVQGNPEPYVLHSSGNIYFYFKRMMARNYMLDDRTPGGMAFRDAITSGGVPAYYNTYDSTIYPPGDGAELFTPTYGPSASDQRQSHTFPAFYYIYNGIYIYDNNSFGTHSVQVESSIGSFEELLPVQPALQWICTAQYSLCREIVKYDDQPAGSRMSVSSAINPRRFPRLDSSWTPTDPKSDPPAVSPNWHGVGTVVLERQPKRTIPIGTGNSSESAHLLIEPVSVLDTQEVGNLKFQTNADLNFTSTDGGLTYTESHGHLPTLTNLGAVRMIKFYDYRIEGCYNALEIDIDKIKTLVRSNPSIMGNDGLLIYVQTAGTSFTKYQECSVNSIIPEMVKLTHGSAVPGEGLTVVTNGRLWIQGNYNTYNRDGTVCTTGEWGNEDCDVPAAAIFSDSFGVLSNEWSDSYGGTTPMAGIGGRNVSTDVMVNTAVVTGSHVSGLERSPIYSTCDMDIGGCEMQPGGIMGYLCPGGFNLDGTPRDEAECEYYKAPPVGNPRFPGRPGVYYLSPYSRYYRNLTTLCSPTQTTECVVIVNPALDPSNPNRWSKVPLFIDFNAPVSGTTGEPEGIRAFPGVYYGELNKYFLTGQTCSSYRCTVDGGCQYICQDTTTESCGSNLTCSVGTICSTGSAEGSTTYNCVSGCRNLVWAGGQFVCSQQGLNTSNLVYFQNVPHMFLLHERKYGGGFENLANLQENWSRSRKLRLSGVMSSPWKSLGLVYNDGKPAYYYQTDYYTAPERLFDYNEDLRDNPPPATPGVFSVRRERWNLKRG